MRIVASKPVSEPLLQLLERHPRVDVVDGGPRRETLCFMHNGRARSVVVGKPSCDVAGLPELMDNNPVVCAETVCLPPPSATLALIALGPLARSGLIVEPPAVMVSATDEDRTISSYLALCGWEGGIMLDCTPQNLGGALAMTAMALIENPDDWADLDNLYEESYGRSFFVRRDEESEWHAGLVLGTPQALFRLRYTQGDDRSLLTIQVMADLNGKCGATQAVHTMNIMAGFEETLGLM